MFLWVITCCFRISDMMKILNLICSIMQMMGSCCHDLTKYDHTVKVKFSPTKFCWIILVKLTLALGIIVQVFTKINNFKKVDTSSISKALMGFSGFFSICFSILPSILIATKSKQLIKIHAKLQKIIIVNSFPNPTFHTVFNTSQWLKLVLTTNCTFFIILNVLLNRPHQSKLYPTKSLIEFVFATAPTIYIFFEFLLHLWQLSILLSMFSKVITYYSLASATFISLKKYVYAVSNST